MSRSIYIYFLFSSILISSVFMIIFVVKIKLSFIISYFISINLTTFLLYLYDKVSSLFSTLRIPEFILHLYTFLGGTPAAYFAQKFLSHKSSKQSFQSTFKKIVLVQLLLALIVASLILYMA